MSSPGLAVVIMGVSGSGKSTIGHLLSNALGCPFLDADDFHSAESKEKMRNGIPLTDSDRIPWLESLRDTLIDYIIRGEIVILACSALQPSYRNILKTADYEYVLEMQESDHKVASELEANPKFEDRRQDHEQSTCRSLHGSKVLFFCLSGSEELFASRLETRHKEGKHFMPPALLKSQMDSLNISENEGVIFVDASLSPEAIADHIRSCLFRLSPSSEHWF